MRKGYVVVAVLLGALLVVFFSLLLLRTSPRLSASLSHRDEKEAVKHKKDFAEKKEEGKKADRPDLFADFHRGIRTRAGEAGPTYPMNYQITELIKARGVTSTQQLSKASSAPLPWIERGPGNVAGRTRSIIVDPDDPTFNTWIVGSVGGGIWKTTDAGQNWQELTKGLTNLATSTLAMAASNPNVIYAGTGEGFGNVDQISGNGVWKSTDRGQTWQQLASTVNNDFRNVTRIIVDPQNENIALVSTAAGFRNEGVNGIFRSTNGGQNWTKVYDAGSVSVEQIIANPQNFKTQYATVNGTGVIKSVDGGVTWNPSSSGILGVGRMELAIAPSDTSRLYISAESDTAKLYISENAGANWALARPLDTNQIDFLGGQGWYDNTIAVHPYDKTVVFAGGVGVWRFEVRPGTSTQRGVLESSFINTQSFLSFVNTGGQLGSGGIVLGNVSAADQPSIEIRFGPGKMQKAHRFLVPEGSTSGVPAANYSYQDYVDVPFEVWDIGTNPNRQLMVSFRDQTRNGQFELEEFEDTRTREYIFPQLETYNATTPSPNIAKAGGHAYKQLYLIWPILTTGATWTPDNLPESLIRIRWGNLTTQNVARSIFVDVYETFGGSSKGVHPDQHHLTFVPTNPAQQQFRIINGNDGGVSFSDDGGLTFNQTGNGYLRPGALKGYNTSQFYGLDKMNGADRYIGGTQDNGSWVSPGNPDAKSDWIDAPSGDGFEAVWHYRDSQKLLESSQFNNLFRSLDGGATWSNVSPPSGNGPFITKIAKSKQDADLVFASSSVGLWRSDNFASDWTLTQMPSGSGFSGSSSFAQVKISLASPQIVWAGHAMTTTLSPFVSTDGGLTFTKTSIFGPSLGSLTGIATHPTDEKTAYALFSIARAPKILRTTDLGQTWTDISGFGNNPTSANGFPDVATFSLLVMPYNTNILWAGTEIGIFESTDGGNTWKYADNGLPPVTIWDMTIVNDEVVVATHGRGIWSVSLPELAGYEPPAMVLAPRFREVGGGLNGFISASINLASAYDSSFVMLDGAKYLKLGANAAPKDTAVVVIVPITTLRNVTVALLSYRAGQSYKSGTTQLQLVPLKTAQVKYSNNFNNPEQADGDFITTGFSFEALIGFANGTMNSPHPYSENRNYIAYLLTPIRVASGNAILKYDDIAIIEPGEDGSVFGDEDFYDYVVVEGSADFGKTWKSLAAGYDARDDARWLTAYNNTLSGAPTMFKSHQIDLLQTFKARDQIAIRFRLFSDPGAVGWGWAVDNLVIQENATSVAEETSSLPMTYHLEQNYPNPFNPGTKIKFALPQNAAVKLVVYNSFGQQVRTLLDAKKEAGFHEIEWDGRNDAGALVATGVYFYKLVTSDYVRTLKMLFVK
jgi:photosystem II stability/assembly factor-like uncharacterized protein